MIKFEEHDDNLFRMLEEPVPLTDDAKMPCLVRLIQDDSPMGRYNRDAAYFDVIGKPFVAQKIKENPFYSNTLHAYEKNSLNQDYCIASIHTLEIIGYPVEDGSRWWALYQMMQGKKVSYKGVIRNVCLALNKDGNVQYYDMDNLAYIGTIRSKLEFGKKDVVKTGWQIYKEPELKYKVGDWVEIESSYTKGKTFVSVIKEMPNQEHYTVQVNSFFGTYTVRGVMERQIVRKLKPSEVIVHIGCMSGTVRPVSTNGIHIWFHLIGVDDKTIATIRISCLDAPTRELVESLLEAQEEEK